MRNSDRSWSHSRSADANPDWSRSGWSGNCGGSRLCDYLSNLGSKQVRGGGTSKRHWVGSLDNDWLVGSNAGAWSGVGGIGSLTGRRGDERRTITGPLGTPMSTGSSRRRGGWRRLGSRSWGRRSGCHDSGSWRSGSDWRRGSHHIHWRSNRTVLILLHSSSALLATLNDLLIQLVAVVPN